jgi:hypothetical protein
MSAILKTKPLQGASAASSREVVSASAGSVGGVLALTEALPIALAGDRLLAFQALQLLMRLDRDLLEARAQWNQDWFRRLMRIRPKSAVWLGAGKGLLLHPLSDWERLEGVITPI